MSQPVTPSATPHRPPKSRNALILGEWKKPPPNEIKFLMGFFGGDEKEVLARSLGGHLRRGSFSCACGREFDVGHTIYRTRRNPTTFKSQGLHAVCLTCVCSWHPSWIKAAKKPVDCEGGCGAYVTSPYRDVYSPALWDTGTEETWLPYARYCSDRCRSRAENRRRSPREEQRCVSCDKSFVKRNDAAYCSSACRQRTYRQRKSEAS